MTALLSSMVVLLAAGSSGAPCYVPTDQTAGWKRVALPDDAPALAAPQDIDQFRTGEQALVFEDDPSTYIGATEPLPGRTTYTFRSPAGARRLELTFAESLRSAKVDVAVFSGGRMFPLLKEKRVAEASLALDWNVADVDYIEVTVHHHFRHTPAVQRWRVGRMIVVSTDPGVPEGFRTPRSLYYRHPGGRVVELCNAPGQRLELERRVLALEPPSVFLRRQP
jgi:hypothetical protein